MEHLQKSMKPFEIRGDHIPDVLVTTVHAQAGGSVKMKSCGILVGHYPDVYPLSGTSRCNLVLPPGSGFCAMTLICEEAWKRNAKVSSTACKAVRLRQS